jgi:Flp pilus assembly protein TadD
MNCTSETWPRQTYGAPRLVISRLINLALLAGMIAFSSFAVGQSTLKGEIRIPKIAVRVKEPLPPKPTRQTDSGPDRLQRARTKTYGDNDYVATFEAALANGNEALAAKNAPDALEYFEQAAIMTTDDPRPFIGQGIALWNLSKFVESQARFEVAEKRFQAINDGAGLSPGHVVDAEQVFRGLGYAALAAGNYQTSLNAYINIHHSEGEDAVTISNNMGIGLVNIRDFDDAESNFKHALSLDPRANDVRLNLGLLYIMLRDRAKAEAVLSELAGGDSYRAGLLRREVEAMPPARVD